MSPMKCPQCGAEVEEQYNFCPQCQAKLRPDAQTPPPGPDPANQNGGEHNVPPYTQNQPSAVFGPMPGTAYDYYTQRNRQNNPYGGAPGAGSGGPYPNPNIPTVNYQPPKKHTGVIVAIVIAAMAVIISIIVGLVVIVNWAVQHTEEYYYQYDWDWDNASWQDTVPQQDTIQLSDSHSVTFPK